MNNDKLFELLHIVLDRLGEYTTDGVFLGQETPVSYASEFVTIRQIIELIQRDNLTNQNNDK